MTSWHLNIWKVKTWLFQERKELSNWSKKYYSMFCKCSPLDLQNKLAKNIVDTTFKRNLQHNSRWKIAEEGFDRLFTVMYLQCICIIGVLNKIITWHTSWIQDAALKWSQVWVVKGKFSSTVLKIQSEIKKSSQFSLWLLQLTVFALFFVTRKSLNDLHIFFVW